MEIAIFIPSHMIVVGYYGFIVEVRVIRPSVRQPIHLSYGHPYFRFWMITGVNINGFSRNLVCLLILWRSGLGLLMGKFCQFLTE